MYGLSASVVNWLLLLAPKVSIVHLFLRKSVEKTGLTSTFNAVLHGEINKVLGSPRMTKTTAQTKPPTNQTTKLQPNSQRTTLKPVHQSSDTPRTFVQRGVCRMGWNDVSRPHLFMMHMLPSSHTCMLTDSSDLAALTGSNGSTPSTLASGGLSALDVIRELVNLICAYWKRRRLLCDAVQLRRRQTSCTLEESPPRHSAPI